MIAALKKRALHRTRILEGQIRGLEKLIESEAYCMDIITQSLAIQKSLASLDKLKAAFEGGGVDLDKPVITSCGSGVTAATLWFALDAIGKPPKSLYDGSWTEYGSLVGVPVALGDEKGEA